MRTSPLLFCLIAITAGGQPVLAQNYAVIDTFKPGGKGKWDYPTIESAAHRLYLSRETHVMVIDTSDGHVIGNIGDTPGVHGIAVARDVGRGYISAGKSNQVRVFDLNTLKVTATLEVGMKPDAIRYDEYSHQVFVFNGHSSNVSVIDAKASAVVATIALDGGPEFAETDGSGGIFVNIESKNELARLDARQRKVTARWPLPGCEGPTGLALDIVNHRSFSVCANAKMTILDTLTGQVIAILPIGTHADGAAFDTERQDAFSANGDGTLTIVHESDANHFAVTQTITTMPGAKTIALDNTSHTLYLPSAIVDTAAGKSTAGEVPGAFVVLVVGPARTP